MYVVIIIEEKEDIHLRVEENIGRGLRKCSWERLEEEREEVM